MQSAMDTANRDSTVNVLVVEDNPGDVGLIKLALDEQALHSFNVLPCDSMASARAAIEVERVDVVLLDLGLPDSSGTTTIKELTSIRPDIPMVAMTGSINPGLAEFAIECGAEDFLVKGAFDPDSLSHSLMHAIEKRKEVHAAAYHATHDDLTGLANRPNFSRRLDQAVELAKTQDRPFALHVLDINRFRDVNEEFGVEFGDAFLSAFGKVLLNHASGSNIVARLGSDEFGLIDLDASTREQFARSSFIISQICSRELTISGQTYKPHVSVGSAFFGMDGNTSSELLAAANYTMRAAKRTNSGFYVSDLHLRDTFLRKRRLEDELHLAVSDSSIFVEYQPIVSLGTGKVAYVEALARWKHDTLGFVLPAEFIALAEETGLIRQLGLQVLASAVCVAKELRNRDDTDFEKIAVNCSIVQLLDSGFCEDVCRIIEDAELPTSMIELEVTETAIFTDEEQPLIVGMINKLRETGILVSLDDFGAGHASLKYLQHLPCDKIKIDRSFVSQVEESASAREICKALVGLGRSLDKAVVAEGIETIKQAEFFKDLGCDFAQGYLFHRPMSFEALLKLN